MVEDNDDSTFLDGGFSNSSCVWLALKTLTHLSKDHCGVAQLSA